MTTQIEKTKDLYIDYAISSFGAVTATGLSSILEGEISHDKVTRMLSQVNLSSKDLWLNVKDLVREKESEEEGVFIVDDSVEKKPFTDESPLVCYHYDHAEGRTIKGINFLTGLYHSQDVSLPVNVHIVTKPVLRKNKKTGKLKPKALFTKNYYFRGLVEQAVKNEIKFRYVLADSWFASAENMKFIQHKLNKLFVMPLKSNRKVALSPADKKQGKYVRVDSIAMEEKQVRTIWLESLDFPLAFAKQVFKNEDGSIGTLYLVSNNNDLSYEPITTLYKKRWNVECYHKSLKQNASLEKSPTKTPQTQINHFFLALFAYIRLERLKISSKINHFALKTKLYVKAIQHAFSELQDIRNLFYCVT